MRMEFWSSRWVLLSCTALAACAAGSDNTTGDGSGTSSGGATTKITSSSGSSGTGTTSGLQGSSSGTGTGTSSGQGTSSGSSGTGDDSGSDDGGSTDDGGSGSSSGGSVSDSGASTGCNGFAGYVRGAAPTSTSASAAGPYQTMSYAATASVRSTMAYDVTSAHIYYPVGATPPYASIAIVPGFVSPESDIADWAPFLASWGIVTMTIGTSNPSTGAADDTVLPPVRGDALIDALTTLRGENTRSGSPLAGKLDVSRQAVAGWSMGGGGTLIDANTHPELKAVFAMEPWNTDTSYPNTTVPSLIFCGDSADGLAGPPMPQNQYMSIPATTPKILYEITKGTHYVSTSPTNSGTDMAPDTTSTPTIARFGLSWLKVFLECDTRFRPFLLVKPTDAEEFDTTVM